MSGCCRPSRSAMARMLAPSNPRSANSAIAALRIEARVSIERCCSALLRGRSRRRPVASLVFFAICPSINIVPNRTPNEVSNGSILDSRARVSRAYSRRASEFLNHRLTHRKLLDLSGHSRREAPYEPDVARDLVVRDPILTNPADTLLVEGSAGPRNNPGTEFFAIFCVRHTENLDVLNIGMPIQILFDFTRIDVLTSADDHILDPSDDAAISVLVAGCQVA